MRRIEVDNKIFKNIEIYIEQYEKETGESAELFIDNLAYIEMDNRGVTFISEVSKFDEYISDSVKKLYVEYGLFRDYINNLFV